MANPYDPLPAPVRGNTADEIHLAVGRALTQWERLEYRVSEIYGVLVGAGPLVSPAARAFGVVAASSARTDMAKEAAEAYLFPPSHADLKKRLKAFLNTFGMGCAHGA